jgi:pilus assembly protein CpaB
MIPWHWLRKANFWLIVGALCVASASYWFAGRYLSRQADAVRAQANAAWATREVVVAATDLPAGVRLAAASLASRAVPERYLSSDVLLPAAVGAAIGQRLTRPLRAGEALQRSAVESPEAGTLSGLVEPGERALTIPVDEANGAAGLLAPGDLVDLMVVLREEGATGTAARVHPLLQAVQVLATGRALRAHGSHGAGPGAGTGGLPPDDGNYATITLRLHPDEAQRVLLAQKLGELSVSLRPMGESRLVALAALGRENLFPGSPAMATRGLRAPRPAVVEYIIGGTAGGQGAPARTASGGRS